MFKLIYFVLFTVLPPFEDVYPGKGPRILCMVDCPADGAQRDGDRTTYEQNCWKGEQRVVSVLNDETFEDDDHGNHLNSI